jgi:hypothetical protein
MDLKPGGKLITSVSPDGKYVVLRVEWSEYMLVMEPGAAVGVATDLMRAARTCESKTKDPAEVPVNAGGEQKKEN